MALLRDTETTDVVQVPDAATPGRRFFGNPWVMIAAAVLVLLILGGLGGNGSGKLGGGLLAHPTWTAPTRDPAWYTWRANLILDGNPGSIAREWGPDNVFSGGYRVTVPLGGALLQRVAGLDTYSFSAFLMIGIPVLAGLAIGAAGYRSRRDPLFVFLALLASAALFLTTPYVGYLDNTMMLFLLCLMFPFFAASRESWAARVALFLIGVAAAFTHPTTCVLFGLSLMAVFGWHFLTSRFRFAPAMKADAPMLWAVGSGMILGLATWLVGIWGPSATFVEAAKPPPYTKTFFIDRLGDWFTSLRPLITIPLLLAAIAFVIWESRRERKPAGQFEITSIGWLFPLVGVASLFVGGKYQIAGAPNSPVVPYYRFVNGTLAVLPLVALGAWFLIRWFLRLSGTAKVAGLIASVLVAGTLGWLLYDGVSNRWVTEANQWADESTRVALAAVRPVADAAGERPIVLIVNSYDNDQKGGTRTNTTYGWAKTFTNVFRTGLSGTEAPYQATWVGTLDDFLANKQTLSASNSEGYNDTTLNYFNELHAREKTYPEQPVAFLIKGYYTGNNIDADAAMAQGTGIGPGVVVVKGPNLWQPSEAVVAQAKAAATAEQSALANPPGPLSDPLHLVRVLLGLFVLFALPGLIAAPFFEVRDWPSRLALVPGMSIVITLLSGIALLAVWRGSLTPTKSWAVVVIALAVAGALRVGREGILAKLASFGNFFNKMTSAFSNVDFSTLMGMQFLAQAGQGIVQGAIAKAISFGGEKGFDVQNLPSADYLLKVVLALYIPYTLISPVIGVFVDRFPRRRVVWWSNIITAVIVTVIAAVVLIPLGKGTTQGKALDTALLVVGLLAVQACVRVALAVKSAAVPDVLSGKDLMQGNGLSQAGGGLFQIIGIVVGGVLAGISTWVPVLIGAGVLIIGAFIARRMQHTEATTHDATFGQELGQVIRNIRAGLKEVAGRAPAALGLSSFQMLRYQFWGFVLFTFGLYAKNLVKTGTKADTLSLALAGVGGLFGGAIGMVVAQKYKDKVAPIRLLLGSMALLGLGTLVGAISVSVAGFAVMLFIGFFAFFVGKISTDTIVQQSMPDGFRGRAFALFDIAYNLGYIVPAAILVSIWVDGSKAATRGILLVSGAAFLVLTAAIASWAKRIRDQFAPQDDLVDAEQPLV